MQIPKFNQTLQQFDSRSSLKRLKRSDDNLKLPENFEIGQAIGGGDCFFDSVAKGLKQLKPDMDFTVKFLRKVCKELAVDNQQLRTQVINDARNSHDLTVIPSENDISDDELWNAYLAGIEYSSDDMNRMQNDNPSLYRSLTSLRYGSTLQVPVWGRPDIEGKVVCRKYGVKLHVIEKASAAEWLHQIVDESGSKSVDNINYNEANTIHIVNKGSAHFEPILRAQEIRHSRSHSDSPDYEDDQTRLSEDLMRTIRGSDSEEEKVRKIRGFIDQGADVNFKDANRDNNTPLHAAVRKGEREVVELLVEKGASVSNKNTQNKTSLELANELNKQDIVQILEASLAKQKRPIDEEDKGNKRSRIPVAIDSKAVHSGVARNRIPYSAGSRIPKLVSQKRPSSNDPQGQVGQSRSRVSITVKQELNPNYRASGLKNTLHGNIYQLKLLMLFLKRGMDKGYSFLLSTEMDEAEKFDDLVFQYENERKDGTVYRFLQAKHKQDESKKITVNDLLTETDGEFSLQKYFISYRKIKQNPEFNGKNDELKDFIICTNIDLDDNLQNSFEKIGGEDNILDIQYDGEQSKRLKLEIDKFPNKERLVSVLKNSSDLNRLAKKLAECVLNSKPLNLNDELFKLYHGALAKEVVDIENAEQMEEINKGKAVKKIYAKFLNGFLGGSLDLSPQAKDFRNSFLEAYLKMPREQVDVDAFWKGVGTKKLQISKNFGKVFELDVNPKLTDPKEFAQAIFNTISTAQQSIVNIKREGGKGQGIIKDNINKLAGHVLIKKDDKEKDIYYFSSAFFDDNNQLPGNLESFRNELKAELESKSIGFNKDEYKFHVANFKTCEEEQLYSKPTLPDDYIAKGEIEDFLDHLIFAVNQPNEVELGTIIKNEIGKEFNYIDSKNVYSRFQKKILNWMKEKEGYFLSHEEGSAFFEKVKKEILGAIWFDVRDPVELFTGRREKLNELHEALQRNQGKDKLTMISQMTSISGLGGVGKSELARKYAYDYGQDYDNNVIWINAEKYETMVESFLKLARDNRLSIPTKDKDGKEKSIESIVKEIYEFFVRGERKSLFIFDNAGRYKTQKKEDGSEDIGIDRFLPSFLPPEKKPYIMVTSRNQELEENIEMLLLDVFTEEEAAEFIRKALKIKDEVQESEVKRLAETLQRFPLALQQAVAYISEENKRLKNVNPEREFWINEYLEEFKREEAKTKELLDFHLPDKNGYTRTTFITWKITLEKIKQREYGQEALDIMDVIAYFAPDKITTKIFLERFDIRELGSALQLLKQYSMIGLEQGEANIHRLVQLVTRIEQKEQKRERDVLREALSLLEKPMKEGENPTGSIYTSHAVSAWDYASKYEELVKKFSGLPSNIINELNNSVRYEEAYLFGVKASKLLGDKLGADHHHTLNARHNVAAALDHQGKYDEALEAYQEVFDKRKQIFGPGHIYTIGTMNNIAVMFFKQGKYDEALEAYQEVFNKFNEALDKLWLMLGSDPFDRDNPFALDVMNNIAIVLSKQGKYDEALQAYQKVLDERKQTRGPDHPDTLKVRNNIATVLVRQGKYDEALATLQETFDKLKQILGPNHPDILTTRNNIAGVLDNQGKYDEALEAYQEVFDKNKQILGPDHPSTLTTRNNIAGVLYHQGKHDEALGAYQEVFDKFKQILGPDHPDTLNTRNNIARVLDNQGKYDEALEAYQEVFDKRKQILGPDYPDTLETKHNIAGVFNKQGKYDEALQANQEVFDKRKQVLGPDHPDTLNTKSTIARVLWSQGKYDEALQANQEVFDKRKQVLGPDHPDTLNTKSTIARVLWSQGKYDEALQANQEVFDKRKQILGPDHPDTLNTKSTIALALGYQGKGKYDEALTVLRNILDKRKQILGPDHPDTLKTIGNIALTLCNQGKYDEALQAYQEVFDKRRQILGPDHPDTLNTKSTIARVLWSQGKYDKALLALKEVLHKIKQVLGPDHPDTLKTRDGIAAVLDSQGKYEEALKTYQKVFGKRKQILGPDHPDTLNTKSNIAKVLDNQGKYKEALEAYQEVFDKRRQALGPGHPDTLDIKSNIAKVLDNQGKYKEALEAYQEVFEKRKQILGPDHPDTLITRHNMAGVLDNQGKYDEALKVYQEVFDKRKVILGPDHPDTLMTQNNVARVLLGQKKYEEAFNIFQEIYEIQKRPDILGPEHPSTLTTLNDMALVLFGQGKYDEALQTYQGVFDKRKVILGSDHPDTLSTKDNIALVLLDQRKYEEALKAYQEVFDKRKVTLGPDHPDTLRTQNNIALVLLGQGAHRAQTDYRPPLHKAVSSGNLNLVRNLIENGADFNARATDIGVTPLHLAALNGHKDIVEALLDKGADFNARTTDAGVTPLHLAALNGNKDIVKALLDKGADFNAKTTNQGATPLHYAAQNGYRKVVEALLEKDANVDALNKDDNTPLLFAIKDSNWEVAIALLRYGANINDLNGNQKEALSNYALNNNYHDIINLLFESGKSTPLHEAAESGNVDVVNALLLQGDTNVNARDDRDWTPLHKAVKNGNINIVNALLQRNNINVNARANGKVTPLHITANNGNLEVINALLKKHADPNVKDKKEKTPLLLAVEGNHLEAAVVLMGYGANIDDFDVKQKLENYLLQIKSVSEDVAKALLYQHDINTRDNRGWTPLHKAVKDGNIDIVNALLKQDNINVDTITNDNNEVTPLHIAAAHGHLDVIDALLKMHADPNIKNKNRKTPLDLATKKNNWETAVILLKHNANVNDLSSDQKDALTSYIFEHHSDNVELLMQRLFPDSKPPQSYEKQQKTFSRLVKYINDHLSGVELRVVKQGLYLPSFKAREVAINGKCVAITRGFSQGMFLKDWLLKLHESFLTNLQTSAELYERIAQGKQVSLREEREIFDLSNLLDNFEQQLDSPTSSLPSDLSHVKSYKTLDDLSRYLSDLTDDFAIHLVTSNHVIAIYRTGNSYAYFDSNVALVSNLKTADQLMKVVKKGISYAGYELAEDGFLVEHFDITKANNALTAKQKQTLTKPIQTERYLLSLQDQRLGHINLNGKQVSRVTLYDLGTKLHLEGSSPILINSDMNLSSENLLAYLNAGKISVTAREYLEKLKGDSAQGLVQTTKTIPFSGSSNEIKHAQQIQELLSSDIGNKLKSYELSKVLKSPIEESIKALPYYLEVAKTKHWPNRLTNAAGRISLFHGGYSSIHALRYGDTEGFALGVGEMSFSLVSQLIEDGVVKITPQLIKQMKHGIHLSRGFAGMITSPFDIYDLVRSSIDASKAVKGSKEWRDSIASSIFSGSSVVSSIAFTAAGKSGAGTVVGLSIIIGQGAYSGASMVIEYKKYRLTTDEEFRLFWHTFGLQLPPEDVQYIEARKNAINELAKNIWQHLQRNDIVAYATGLGEITFRDPSKDSPVNKTLFASDYHRMIPHANSGSGVPFRIRPVGSSGNILEEIKIKPKIPILSLSNATILMGLSDLKANYRHFLSRVLPDSPASEADMLCLPAFSGKDYEYDYTLSKKGVPVYSKSSTVTSYCENAVAVGHKQRMNQTYGDKKIVFDLNLVNQGMIVGSNKWHNDFIVSQGGAKVLGGENTKNIFILTSNLFSGTIFGGKNSTNTLDASNLKNSHYLLHVDNLSTFDRIKYVQDYVINKKHVVEQVNIYGISNLIISANIEVVGNGDKYTFYVKPSAGHSRVNIPSGYLVFPDVVLLLDCDSFTYSPESNVLSMKLSDFTLDIANYYNKHQQTCNFELIDKHGSVIEPLVDLAQNNSQEVKLFNLRAETDLTYNDIPEWYENITEANGEYQVYGTVKVKYPIAQEKYGSYPHMIVGSQKSDIIPLTKETWHAEGREGSDSYNVISGHNSSITTEINNYAEDGVIDLLYMPVNSIQVSRDNNNLHLYSANSTHSVKVKDYFVNSTYQHLTVIDENKDVFVPRESSSNNHVQLVPFYHATKDQYMFSLSAEKVASSSEVIVDAKLDNMKFYRDGSNLMLIDNKPIIVKLENFYDKHESWQNLTINFWHGHHKDKLNSQQLFELSKLAINYQDEIKSAYYDNVKEYIVSASNTTIHHNQKFVNGSLTTVEPSTKRVGVVVLQDPSDIEVSVDDEDLVFFVTQNNATFTIKNWNDTDHRVSTLRFNQEKGPVEIKGLDKFDLSQVSEIQSLINQAALSSIATQQLEKLDSNVVNGIKYLLAVRGIENGIGTHKCLGFDSAEEEQQFISAYHSRYSSEKLSQVLHHNQASEALVWLVVKGYTDLSLENQSIDRKNDLNKCFNAVTNKRVISRIVRKLEVGNIEEIIPNMESFIRHHKEALEDRVVNSLRSNTTEIIEDMEESNHQRKRRDESEVKGYEDSNLLFHAQNNATFTIKNNQVTSGASKLSSWINTAFGFATKGISKLGSFFPTINAEHPTITMPLHQGNTQSSPEPQHIDLDGTILLLDVLIRKLTGEKYVSSVGNNVTSSEIQASALSITEEFEGILNSVCDEPAIDFAEVESKIFKAMMNGSGNKIPGILCSYVEETKLEPEVTKKILGAFQPTKPTASTSEGHKHLPSLPNTAYNKPQTCLSNIKVENSSVQLCRAV